MDPKFSIKVHDYLVQINPAHCPFYTIQGGDQDSMFVSLWKYSTLNEKKMEGSDFTTTVVVDQTAEEVFNAIRNVRGWWSQEIQGSTQDLNDEFIYRYKDAHSSKMKLVEVVPSKRIVWLVMDNYFNFTKDKSEWKGNRIVFDISEKGGKRHLKFTQEGLVPSYECYDICRQAWGNYVNTSLRSLITTGKGAPNSKENTFNDELLEQHKK
jgi:hypothetical protein